MAGTIHHLFLKEILISSILLVGLLLPVQAQIHYSSKDSMQVEKLLQSSVAENTSSSQILYFAKSFLNIPYKASTLEIEGEEQLVVNLQGLDCTTYVETVIALYLASQTQKKNWDMFTQSLQRVRYRSGNIDGYESRLHYFSEWILDNEQKGIVEETTCDLSAYKVPLNLHYMSSYPESYPKLKNNPVAIRKIKEVEQKLNDKMVCIIPENEIANLHSTQKVREGDVVAFTTNMDGLDITHVGFAIRKNNKLHLLHASSRHKKVVIDPLSLDEYVKNGSRLTGIRILSVR